MMGRIVVRNSWDRHDFQVQRRARKRGRATLRAVYRLLRACSTLAMLAVALRWLWAQASVPG